jgi:hypothetical protein
MDEVVQVINVERKGTKIKEEKRRKSFRKMNPKKKN